ncbi:MAG: UDP-glucose 4-epimerase [Candidatus Moranbacteria bacterium RIFOXYB1_FULL_43_19]|nr:MAG: UDP-glucose 4-epimerase [Candidatus Moranbacteria bacterium RIFOXYB1_FULL_43_19]OGI32998.1 MAG: UDP-glucose 4-epimerase [Candidatus Moranbacteria bacterium RIFOXYC1_FULL_44_13]OGI38213.1 MAG: UDP-glucose 4-epimerase [Candidatus Moranbacteria bacterium RIFOXYD1_FULL_44_12]
MKILVTGGAGFIGSHLVDALIEKNHRVFVIDNLSTGFKKNINPKAKFFRVDLTNHKKIEVIIKKEKPEVIFHLAAQIDVRKSMADPVFDTRSNILASVNLINLAREYRVKKFIFSSTGGAIYGDTKNRPTGEKEPEWPLSPYGIAKLTVDKFLFYYREVHGLNFVSLRYSNVYGPRQNPHGEAGVVAIFLNKMLKGDQPVINGNGKQTRDYVYVGDVVSANLLALKNFTRSGIYNVGTGKETDVNQLFWEINCHFGKKFKEVHGPAKMGEQKTSCLDFAKIKKEFGWKPKVDFKTGIGKTFEWFSKNL